MPIKIKCTNPNCGKILNAPDSMAGKRANCPSCKTTLTVAAAPVAAPPAPAAPAAPPAPAKPAVAKSPAPENGTAPRKPAPPPPAPPPAAPLPSYIEHVPPEPTAEDAEKIAAALLGDEPKAEETQKEFIEFTCQWCDELVKVDFALGGKQTPCPNPECRRITKVPMPVDPKKVAWRDSPKKPVGARLDTEPAPEGVWGSTTNRGVVSKESLEEAGALPERAAPVGARTWIARGMTAAAVIVLLVTGTVYGLRWLGGKREAALVKQAQDAVEGKTATLTGAEAGLVYRGTAEYYLHHNKPGSVRPDKGEAGAWNQFAKARARLGGAAAGNVECEAMLIDLALAQFALAGGDKEVAERRRLTWKDTIKEVERTLQQIPVGAGRNEAIRLVTRQLLEKGQGALVDDLIALLKDGPQTLTVFGLEKMRAGQREEARKLFTEALELLKANKPHAPLTAEVVALATALDVKEAEWPRGEGTDANVVEIGKAVGAVFQSPSKARELAKKLPTAVLKAEALANIADLLTDATEARTTVAEAVGTQVQAPAAQPGAPWTLARLVRLGLANGEAEAELLALTNRIPESGSLRGWAQLQLFRRQLNAAQKAEESLLDTVDKSSLSHRQARIELARHNTRRDSAAAKAVDSWDASVRPFGHIGAAQGLQGSD